MDGFQKRCITTFRTIGTFGPGGLHPQHKGQFKSQTVVSILSTHVFRSCRLPSYIQAQIKKILILLDFYPYYTVENPYTVGKYHSLFIKKNNCPSCVFIKYLYQNRFLLKHLFHKCKSTYIIMKRYHLQVKRYKYKSTIRQFAFGLRL